MWSHLRCLFLISRSRVICLQESIHIETPPIDCLDWQSGSLRILPPGTALKISVWSCALTWLWVLGSAADNGSKMVACYTSNKSVWEHQWQSSTCSQSCWVISAVLPIVLYVLHLTLISWGKTSHKTIVLEVHTKFMVDGSEWQEPSSVWIR